MSESQEGATMSTLQEDAIQVLEDLYETLGLPQDVCIRIIHLAEQIRPQILEAIKAAENARLTEHPRLQIFAQQYQALQSEIRERCSWDDLKARLLANECEKLKKVLEMRGGGKLFGISVAGEGLFKNDGDAPVDIFRI